MQGQLVHFVLPDGPEQVHGQCRPALVVQDQGVTGPRHLLNLIIFHDGSHDRRMIAPPGYVGTLGKYDDSLMEWRTSIHYAHPKEFGTWHRLEDCGNPV